MPRKKKQKQLEHLKEARKAVAKAPAATAATAARVSIPLYSDEGKGAFDAKYAAWEADNVEAAAKGLLYWMREDHATKCCDKCKEMQGAPFGWLAKSLKNKKVSEMKDQLVLHGIDPKGMNGVALKSEIDKLVALKAKVLQRYESNEGAPKIAPSEASGSGLPMPPTPPKSPAIEAPAPKRRRSEARNMEIGLSVDQLTPGGPARERREARHERKSLDAAAAEVGPRCVLYEDPELETYLKGEGKWPQRRREALSFAITSAVRDERIRLSDYQSVARDKPSQVEVSDRTDRDSMNMCVLKTTEFQMALRLVTAATLRVSWDWIFRGHDALRQIRAGVRSGAYEDRENLFPHFYHRDGLLAVAGDTTWSHRRNAPSCMTCLTEPRTGIHVWSRVMTKMHSPCLIAFPELVSTSYPGSSQTMDPDNTRLCVEYLMCSVQDDLFARVIEVHDGDAKVLYMHSGPTAMCLARAFTPTTTLA
jgi:hypothetical protein